MDCRTYLQAGWTLYGKNRPYPNPNNGDRTKEEYVTFRSHFGTEPIMCVELWTQLDPENDDDFPVGVKPEHLLWALYHMRVYNVQRVEDKFLKSDRKTVRKWIWIFIRKMSTLTLDLILWSNRLEGGPSPIPNHTAALDCTQCPLQEQTPFSKDWSGHKFGKKAAVNYEMCTSITTGWIVWVSGPYPAGAWPDRNIFDRDLIYELEIGEKLLADSGYTGRDTYITISNLFEIDPIKKKAKAREEQTNGRFKAFRILTTKFREDVGLHHHVFHAIAAIVQLEIQTGVALTYSVV